MTFVHGRLLYADLTRLLYRFISVGVEYHVLNFFVSAEKFFFIQNLKMEAEFSAEVIDRFLPALQKFVPPPFPPPEPIPSSNGPLNPSFPFLKKDENSSDENVPPAPRRSNSEPPAPSGVGRSPKRRGDGSPRSESMSPARKMPRFASPGSPGGAAVIRKNSTDNSVMNRPMAENPDPAIDDYFRFVAKFGRTLFHWEDFR